MSEKPTVLLLGGCGFIGRNLLTYLIENDLSQEIRVVDKTPPQMAWLNARQTKAFENGKVEFFSANLINPNSCKNAFIPHPTTGRSWDLVFNCAAETRPNQTEAVYKEGIQKLSLNCANEAMSINAQRYIEYSSGCVNSVEKYPSKEDWKHDPWTAVAKHKLKVEKELQAMENFNYTIVRLPVVYGCGDKRYLSCQKSKLPGLFEEVDICDMSALAIFGTHDVPRVIIAAIYKHLNETMKLLWNDAMKLSTVHIDDVCAASWLLATSPKANREIYNIADDAESTQGTISDILAEIFSINIDYFGIVMSNLTRLSLSDTVSEINDKHLVPWAEICQQNGISNTPLTPYLDEEQLYHKHLNLDNTKLKEFGYQLKHPKVTTDLVKAMVDDYIEQKLFPKSLVF